MGQLRSTGVPCIGLPSATGAASDLAVDKLRCGWRAFLSSLNLTSIHRIPPLCSLVEKLRTLGYPTVPTYSFGLDDVEGLDLGQSPEPEDEDAEDEGRVTAEREAPEGIKALQKRIADWCKAMVRILDRHSVRYARCPLLSLRSEAISSLDPLPAPYTHCC